MALSALAPTVDVNADDCERFVGVMTAYRKEKPQERHGSKRGRNAASSVAGIRVAAILSLGPGSSSLIEDLWKNKGFDGRQEAGVSCTEMIISARTSNAADYSMLALLVRARHDTDILKHK